MSIFDRHIQATKVPANKPHIFFHQGYWRVNTKPRYVCRDPLGVANNRWNAAHDFVRARNAAYKIMRGMELWNTRH